MLLSPRRPGPLRLAALVLAAAFIAGRAPVGTAANPAFISVAELAEHVDTPGLVLVHVGHGARNYERGHLPGAHFVDRTQVMIDAPDGTAAPADIGDVAALARGLGIDAESEVVLMGDAHGVFPALLATSLERLGVRHRMLDGQVRGWAAADLPLTRDVPAAPTPTDFAPTARPAAFVPPADAAARPPARRVIDVRPARQFSGEKPGRGVERAGRIPGAFSFPLNDCFVGHHPPLLVDRDALRERLAAGGIAPGDPVLVCDGFGTHAALARIILRDLGFADVQAVSGGYAAWDAAGLPIEGP